ncbi:hypothetical protein K1T35_16155 [Pseudonocardia sp. DSM 110487]|uniref:hypothetical protein n=1 Tax=Pseudonocardia sp. DSM 110487 TaxID=2865833 RepID=UPI001C698E12|nr:hypothetical protein [Pseudonocardia sp. DSM 110487]QYN38607.1 hypothetical protein K1T35_16155 [Pseudonocardia sp. DSM 110487]
MTAADQDPIVVFIAGEAGSAERLIREHADDGSGRCKICAGGPQAGHVRWPCRLYDYAIRARAARREQASQRVP